MNTVTSEPDLVEPGPALATPLDRSPTPRRLSWLWPALLAAVLGAYDLTRPELWRDELATWDAATRTTSQLFDLLRHTDASSGAYYLLMHGWTTVFGDSTLALRLPALLATIGAAALVTLVGRRLFGARAGLTAGLLFALLPAVSRYAQEARSYALTMFAVTAVTLLLLRALDRPSLLRWGGYGVVTALVGAVNLVALSFLAGHLVVAAAHWWYHRDRRVLLGFPLAALVGVLLDLPLVRISLGQASGQIFWIPKPTLAGLYDLWPQLFGSTLVAGAVVITAVLAFGGAHRQAISAAALAVLPIVAIGVVSAGPVSYWLPRYLLFTLPAWAVLAGAGLAALRPVAGVLGLVVLAAIGLPDQFAVRAPGSHDWWNYPAPPMSGSFSYSGAAAVIAQGYRDGDGLVPARDGYPAGVYLIDTGLRYHLPANVRPRDVFAVHTGVQLGGFFTQDTTNAKAALGTEQRLWLVNVGNPADLLTGLAPDKAAALRDGYTVAQVAHPTDYTTVALLVRKH